MGIGQWAMGNGQWRIGNGLGMRDFFHAPCPMPHAQCPSPQFDIKIHNLWK
ncbi:MAG: hypothetical protein KME31_25835 [Tolypothrix carrinoi HA7290-LM1]|nr:hypothetical protein [Tolypothrix carrinoi HA7290-LM1]